MANEDYDEAKRLKASIDRLKVCTSTCLFARMCLMHTHGKTFTCACAPLRQAHYLCLCLLLCAGAGPEDRAVRGAQACSG